VEQALCGRRNVGAADRGAHMSLRLVRAVGETENLDDFHLSRLLVLLGSVDGRKSQQKTIEGITKLAKLDFLLRYPTCLERALEQLGKDPVLAHVEPRERTSIESKMVRFRYGPWDSRYRRWLGLLFSRGLVTLQLEGNTVHVGLTNTGRELATKFRKDPLYSTMTQRSDLLIKVVGRMTATALKEFVYEVIPEIIDMKWGEEIAVQPGTRRGGN
jgi:hypothetical protein